VPFVLSANEAPGMLERPTSQYISAQLARVEREAGLTTQQMQLEYLVALLTHLDTLS
jgi:hypothetical protein